MGCAGGVCSDGLSGTICFAAWACVACHAASLVPARSNPTRTCATTNRPTLPFFLIKSNLPSWHRLPGCASRQIALQRLAIELLFPSRHHDRSHTIPDHINRRAAHPHETVDSQNPRHPAHRDRGNHHHLPTH